MPLSNICRVCGIPIHVGKFCNKCFPINQFDPLIESNPLLKESEKLFKLVFETLYKKNSDYSNTDNPFSNFENSAKRVGITVQQGILVRLNDKVERLCNLLQQGKSAKVTGETIEDTICDLIGYAAILYSFRLGQVAKGEDPEV